jgi:hypothetical protein
MIQKPSDPKDENLDKSFLFSWTYAINEAGYIPKQKPSETRIINRVKKP